VWWRLGHNGLQTLDQTPADPNDQGAYWARREVCEEDERRAAELPEREREQEPNGDWMFIARALSAATVYE
jgi:hypothetical protein